MKIKIDKLGYLNIERAGKMAAQDCPATHARCGDWCPLFGEPYRWGGENGPDTVMRIELCGGKTLICAPADFTDERGKN